MRASAASGQDEHKETGGKTVKWKDKVKMDALAEEKKAVGDLINW